MIGGGVGRAWCGCVSRRARRWRCSSSKVGPVAAWQGVLARRAPRAVLAATAARTQNVTGGGVDPAGGGGPGRGGDGRVRG